MFDIGATELLLVAVVAILVIGPKDMPLALRTAGRWVGKMRKMSAHFRAGVDNIVREAELEDMEKKWKAQNEKIMREHPEGAPAEMEPTGAYPPRMQPQGDKPALDKPAADKPMPDKPTELPKTSDEKAEELRLIAEKRQAAAEEAEMAAKHAAAEARLAAQEASQAAGETSAPDTAKES